jgi:hypothetical protein
MDMNRCDLRNIEKTTMAESRFNYEYQMRIPPTLKPRIQGLIQTDSSPVCIWVHNSLDVRPDFPHVCDWGPSTLAPTLTRHSIHFFLPIVG